MTRDNLVRRLLVVDSQWLMARKPNKNRLLRRGYDEHSPPRNDEYNPSLPARFTLKRSSRLRRLVRQALWRKLKRNTQYAIPTTQRYTLPRHCERDVPDY